MKHSPLYWGDSYYFISYIQARSTSCSTGETCLWSTVLYHLHRSQRHPSVFDWIGTDMTPFIIPQVFLIKSLIREIVSRGTAPSEFLIIVLNEISVCFYVWQRKWELILLQCKTHIFCSGKRNIWFMDEKVPNELHFMVLNIVLIFWNCYYYLASWHTSQCLIKYRIVQKEIR